MDEAAQQNQHDDALLAQYRANLRHLEDQVAVHGGDRQAPVYVMNQVRDARKDIAALKQGMRERGASVADDPGDFPAGQPDAPSAQALLDTMPLAVVPDLASIPPFSRMPYASNPHFVGRDDALLALAQALKGGGRVALGPRAAATGLGGIGKTSVAAEFVHRYGQYFAGGVFWLSFADPAAVPGEVAACGGVGFLDLRSDFGDLKQDEQVALVTAAWRQETPRLLVFDNCEDPNLVEAWAPPTGGCRVLITCRRQRWPGGLRVRTQRLDVLVRQSSIALLQQLAPRLTDVEANAIAEELGDLPLALQLAGSYLAQFERTKVATYLAELTSDVILKHPSLQGKHDEDVSLTAHDRHVGRTVLVSYQRLKADDPTDALAIQLLARAACLAPGEPIPVDLLLATAGLDAESTDGQMALQRLIDLGFLSSDGDDTVQLHRLIHAFVQAVVSDQAAYQAVATMLCTKVEAINDAWDPRLIQPVLPHLRWLRDCLPPTDVVSIPVLHILSEHALYTRTLTEAMALCQTAYERSVLLVGPTHPLTARSLHNQGTVLAEQGDHAAAQALLEQALALRTQLLGSTHPDHATTLHNLAIVHHEQGELDVAQQQYADALAIRMQTLGPTHPATLRTRQNLAGVLQALALYPAARVAYEQVIATLEATLGPDHPGLIPPLLNLARLLQRSNDTTAITLYERAYQLAVQIYGITHPTTVITLHRWAACLYARGEISTAQTLITTTIDRLRSLPADAAVLTDPVVVHLYILAAQLRQGV